MKFERLSRRTAIAFAAFLPAVLFAQNPTALEHRAEVSLPDHYDRTPTALRDLPDRRPTTPARGGRDFEPGRPAPVGDTNPFFVDPLAAKGAGPVTATSIPLAATVNGTPVDPTYRVAPPDTTGDLGPNHYVQWVNLRLASTH